MSLMPHFKKCPCCDSLNFVRSNGALPESRYQNLKKWKLLKVIRCRKCKEELGFIESKSKNEGSKLIWMNLINIEQKHFNKLNLLKKMKNKTAKIDIQYQDILKDIRSIEDQIVLEKNKLKIRFKIEKKFF